MAECTAAFGVALLVGAIIGLAAGFLGRCKV